MNFFWYFCVALVEGGALLLHLTQWCSATVGLPERLHLAFKRAGVLV